MEKILFIPKEESCILKILIIGTGYVGTTTGLVFCEMGHQVTGLDLDIHKIEALKAGKLYFYEPGLDELLVKHVTAGNISFTNDTEKAVKENDLIFICVGTPQGADGSADLTFVKNAAKSIGAYMNDYKVIVDKSTVPIGTAEMVIKWIQSTQSTPIPFDVVSNPEFLREGSAVKDALNPDRIVMGATSETALKIMKDLYKDYQCPIVETEPRAAELIKYASNAFLALKISYINELARLCYTLNININEISCGIGLDKRIGSKFLNAGIGYGGSCFPKDVSALIKTASQNHHELTILQAAIKVNEGQTKYFVERIKERFGNLQGKRIAILGLAFKANTDDTRESPSLRIIKELLKEQAFVTCYDPAAKISEKEVIQFHSMVETLLDCDAVVICTDWKEFADADWKEYIHLLNTPIVFDGKNLLDEKNMKKLGFEYYKV
jgi:UDPglucose 6-dehydrogenase